MSRLDPLSASARQRLARAQTLRPGLCVQVFDERLALGREGVLTENRLHEGSDPRLVVRFKVIGRQDDVEYRPADFERFDVSRAA